MNLEIRVKHMVRFEYCTTYCGDEAELKLRHFCVLPAVQSDIVPST